MRLRSVAGMMMLSGLIFCTAWTGVQAATSDGLTLRITKASANQAELHLQFQLTNDTKARIYILYVTGQPSNQAFLGSGDLLNSPLHFAGIELCGRIPLTACAEVDPSYFSYIEPGDALDFTVVYQGSHPIDPGDNVSFSIVLFAKYSPLGGNPEKPDPGRPVRFNFVRIPLNIQ